MNEFERFTCSEHGPFVGPASTDLPTCPGCATDARSTVRRDTDECGNCAFGVKREPEKAGFDLRCHRHSPIAVKSESMAHYVAQWPYVSVRDWCGDYQEKAKP